MMRKKRSHRLPVARSANTYVVKQFDWNWAVSFSSSRIDLGHQEERKRMKIGFLFSRRSWLLEKKEERCSSIARRTSGVHKWIGYFLCPSDWHWQPLIKNGRQIHRNDQHHFDRRDVGHKFVVYVFLPTSLVFFLKSGIWIHLSDLA